MTTSTRPTHFLAERAAQDLDAGRCDHIVTRFPPEPNGYLHVGHSKSILLNHGLAEAFGGEFHLRMDDTNPSAEEGEYVASIERDVAWLVGDVGRTYYASDTFERMYHYAEELVVRGLAYVDSLSKDEVRARRGSFETAGRDSPHRNRSVAENLDLFRRMRAGEFDEGHCVLRAKIDMAHPNMIMRDPPLYRIKKARHHRSGDAWCIYPMYDYAHPLEDAFEGITHSICTLEFESNRELYDWVLDAVGGWKLRPHQHEFARLALAYTVVSKRKLLQLVTGGDVAGWDDPRMPTLAGLRRRGVRPQALRAFADLIGVARNNSLVDIGKLEFCVRQDLEALTPRALCVLRPLKVVLTDWPAERVQWLDVPWFPDDPTRGSRKVPFGRELWIEAEDFAENPPDGWHRLAPGAEVRLRHGFVVRCHAVVHDASGAVVEVHCAHDPASQGGATGDGRKVKGTLHWVSAPHAAAMPVRLYDRLFTVELPDADDDFRRHLNPRSLEVLTAYGEPALRDERSEARVQFERVGWFFADPIDSGPGAPVWNRVMTLRDSWVKADAATSRPERGRRDPRSDVAVPGPAGATGAADGQPGSARAARVDGRAAARAQTPALAEAFERWQRDWGVARDDADVLTDDLALMQFVEAAARTGPPLAVVRWAVNDLPRAIKDRGSAATTLGAAVFGDLVARAEAGTLGARAGKDALAWLCEHGGSVDAALAALGVGAGFDEAGLAAAIDQVLAEMPSEVERFRSGEAKLLSVLLGAAMRATRGTVAGKQVRERLLMQLR
ncbi:MAG: glutamine--tRNA ligase/YqeY domain fusion protein [Myxococcales bacterium]|nr:glutamine--tRNA ligase/YqeY domain fusion protein [Myxococcales bacterium]